MIVWSWLTTWLWQAGEWVDQFQIATAYAAGTVRQGHMTLNKNEYVIWRDKCLHMDNVPSSVIDFEFQSLRV